jgi:hypothetical protein
MFPAIVYAFDSWNVHILTHLQHLLLLSTPLERRGGTLLERVFIIFLGNHFPCPPRAVISVGI